MADPWHCHGTAVAHGMPWHCHGTAKHCHGIAMALARHAMALPWHYRCIAMALLWHCHGSAMSRPRRTMALPWQGEVTVVRHSSAAAMALAVPIAPRDNQLQFEGVCETLVVLTARACLYSKTGSDILPSLPLAPICTKHHQETIATDCTRHTSYSDG